MIKYYKNLFAETWSNAEKTSVKNNSVFNPKFINTSIIIILVYLAFAMSAIEYFGSIKALSKYILTDTTTPFNTWFHNYFYDGDIGLFHRKFYWSGSITLIYLIIPCLIVKFVFKKSLKDFGISFTNIGKDYPLYLLMLAIMLPILYLISYTQSFQNKYPLFQPAINNFFPLFIWWQIIYFIQFIATEFLFRGFLIHGLKLRFGFYSIFISTVPYCMIHFGKPFAETIAAIIAGVVLGTLSLKSRSIILGIIIHYSVAIIMDLFALYREGIIHF